MYRFFRPWGFYENHFEDNGYKLKSLTVVKPCVYPIPLLVIVTPKTRPLSSPIVPIVALAIAPNPSPLIMTLGAVV